MTRASSVIDALCGHLCEMSSSSHTLTILRGSSIYLSDGIQDTRMLDIQTAHYQLPRSDSKEALWAISPSAHVPLDTSPARKPPFTTWTAGPALIGIGMQWLSFPAGVRIPGCPSMAAVDQDLPTGVSRENGKIGLGPSNRLLGLIFATSILLRKTSVHV